MTDKELVSSLAALEETQRKETDDLRKRHTQERKDLLQSWANAKTPFKTGDVIRSKRPHDGRYDYVRIENIEGHAPSEFASKPEIWYVGTQLLPDLTSSSTSSKGVIIDDGSKQVEKLTRPPYTGFAVSSESGEKGTPSYRDALAMVKKNARNRESSKVYGILPSGERAELLDVPFVEIPKIPHQW